MKKRDYDPTYEIGLPVDKRVVEVRDGLDGEPKAADLPVFTNPDDPVSPQSTTEAVGAVDYPIEHLQAFPDDPSLEPVYDTPPA
jgi:hypothetical protein